MLAGIQLRENVGRGAAKLQRRLSRDRLDVRHAPNAVGSENLFRLRHSGYCSGGL